MDTDITNNKKSNSAVSKILFLLRPYKIRIISILICALVSSALMTLQPLIRQHLIDDGVIGGNLKKVIFFTSLIFALFSFNQTLQIILFFSYKYINELLSFRLFQKSFRHLLKLPVSFFKASNSSKIIQDIEYDVSNIARISESTFVTAIVQGLCMVGGIIGLMIINWKLALPTLFMIPTKILVNNYYSKKRTKKFEKVMKLYSSFYDWIGEAVQGITTIKMWLLFEKKFKEFIKLRRDIIHNNYGTARIEQKNSIISNAIDELFYSAVYIFGAIFIFNGKLTIGGLFSFISYSSVVIGSISFLTRIRFYFDPIVPSIKRYFEFLDIEEEHEGHSNLPLGSPHLRFDNISVSYDGITDVLKNVTFEIKPGEKAAVVGANGSGKSSLIQLLLRLCEPSNGKILYCGYDIQEIQIDKYRNIFSLMEQKIFLFNSSVRENIDLNKGRSDEEIMFAAETVGFFQNLTEGLNSAAGVDGTKLSGGERQKLAIIRAWIKPHKILILDEATNNLDSDSERALNDFLIQKCDNQIVLIVTHRADILKNVNKILVMDKGVLVGQGTFDELINSCAAFEQILSQWKSPNENI